MPTRTACRSQLKSDATRHVRDLLRVMVLADRFGARGGALPGEAELMLEFGATRNVVREVLNLLRDEALVERSQGAGTFVVSEKILHRFDMLRGAGDGLEDRAHRLAGELPSIGRIVAPAVVSDKLGLSQGEECLRVDAVSTFDGSPFSLTTGYLRAGVEATLGDATFNGDWYEFLESLGLQLQSSAMSVEAIVADDVVAPWLGVAAGAPLMLFTRLISDRAGLPVEFGFVRVRADRVQLQLPLARAVNPSESSLSEDNLLEDNLLEDNLLEDNL